MTGDERALGAATSGDLDAWAVATMVWHRKWLVLAVTLVAIAGALAVLAAATPRYSSRASIIVETGPSDLARPERGDSRFLIDQAAVSSQLEVLSSRDLAARVVHRLRLAEIGEFRPGGSSPVSALLQALGLARGPSPEPRREEVVDAFLDGLKVHQRGSSQVIAVEFTSSEPERAAEIANALAEEYIALRRATRSGWNRDAVAWLGREIDELRDRAAQAERKVAAFREATGTVETARGSMLDGQQPAPRDADLAALEREAAARREILETFQGRYREAIARQVVQAQAPDARIVSHASPSATPSYPPRGPILALASLAGVLVGVVAAIAAAIKAARRRAGAGPDPGAAEPDPAPAARRAPAAESHSIGRRIALFVTERSVRRIAVMRFSGDEGALNAALRIAGEVAVGGLEPVVVEIVPDPSTDAAASGGLYDLLAGRAALGEVLGRDRVSGAHLLPAGVRPGNADDLIGSGRVGLVLDALLRRFDVVMIAAGGIDDARAAAILGGVCDLVLVAAPAGELSGRRIKSALGALRAAGIEQAAFVSEGADTLTLYDAVTLAGPLSDAA